MLLVNPPAMPDLGGMLDNEQCDEQCKHFYMQCVCQTLDMWPF